VIGSFANLRAAGGSISIGPDCLIAQHVSLIASNHQLRAGQTYWRLPWDEQKTGVTLGQNVWLGCGVTVLPGVSIGDHAVVGANSVVTKSIPAGTVWAGNPARQLRTIS
jgi:acetyltransferase-like isoleucine patch superfamily enzyme